MYVYAKITFKEHFMKKLLFLFILIASISKGQNDTIRFFAFTDNNNNCVYEPGSGEQPLINYCFKFDYQFPSLNIQSNTKPTDNYGYVKFPATGALSPASNTLTTNGVIGFFSNCYTTNTNYPYNTTYTVPVYSPIGYKQASITNMYFDQTGASMPGYTSFCIGKTTVIGMTSGFNYIDFSPSPLPVNLGISGGSVDNQTVLAFFGSGSCSMGVSAAPVFLITVN